MEDQFLIRVDEEMPSDERVAVKIIETGVGHEINEIKLRMGSLLERVETIAATNNIEILREMKDILSGLLESVTSINKKYAFVSEMILRIDEKVQNPIDTAFLENRLANVDTSLGQMTDGIAKLLADIQIALENLNTNFSTNSQSTARLEEKINEKFVKFSISNAELDEKIDAISADVNVKMQEMFSQLGETVNAAYMGNSELIGKLNERLATLNSAGELTGKINEIYVNTNTAMANLEGKLVRINSDINSRLEELSISNAELIERTRSLSSDMSTISERLNEKMGEMSVMNAEITEKMRELLSGDKSNVMEGKLAELQADMGAINEKLSNNYIDRTELMGRLDEISSGTAELIKGIEEKVASLDVSNAELLARLEEKMGNTEMLSRLEERMNSATTNNVEVLGRLEEKVTDMQIDNKQNLSRIEDVVNRNIITPEALDLINQRISNLRDGTRNDINTLAEEIRKYREGVLSLKPKPRLASRARRPRKARRKLARPRKRQIEDEALDILILNTLKNVSMSIDSLSRATNVSETRLRKRLTVLMTRGVVVREKRGGFIFYASRTEETK